MVSVENLNLSSDCEVEKWKIAAEKRNLNFAAENIDMCVVEAYMNFGSASAIEVVDHSVEVHWNIDYFRKSGL